MLALTIAFVDCAVRCSRGIEQAPAYPRALGVGTAESGAWLPVSRKQQGAEGVARSGGRLLSARTIRHW